MHPTEPATKSLPDWWLVTVAAALSLPLALPMVGMLFGQDGAAQESLGLLPKVGRTEAGYRRYSDNAVHTLRFIQRSRDLGFLMAEIADLLKLWQDRRRSSASVKKVASTHLEELDQKIAEMQSMRKTLQHLVQCCHDNQRPDCPILDELGGAPPDLGHSPER